MVCSASPTTETAPIRLMELADIEFAVRMHTTHLPRGFFVDLGPRFLTAYYRSYLTSPAAVGLVACLRDEPVAFLVGTVDRAAHIRHVVQADRVRLIVLGVGAMALRPSLALRFVSTRATRYVRGLRRYSRPLDDAASSRVRYGVLSHVAVMPECRGRAIGSRLIEAFTDVARISGAVRSDVMTRNDNEGARRLYERLGWEQHETQIDTDGHSWVTYRRTLA